MDCSIDYRYCGERYLKSQAPEISAHREFVAQNSNRFLCQLNYDLPFVSFVQPRASYGNLISSNRNVSPQSCFRKTQVFRCENL